MPDTLKDMLAEFKMRLEKLYGQDLKSIILYGSWARNEAADDSDVDLTVVLKGNISPGREIDRMIEIITDINLRYKTLIAVYPVSEENYLAVKSPLLLNIHREGISV